MPRRSATAVTMIAPTRTRMSSSMRADSGSPGGFSPGTSVEEKKRHDAAGTPVTAGVVPSWASRSRVGWPPTSLSGHRAVLPPPPHAGGGNPLTGPPLSSRARTRCHFHITAGVRQDLVGHLSKVGPGSAYLALRRRTARALEHPGRSFVMRSGEFGLRFGGALLREERPIDERTDSRTHQWRHPERP